MTWARRPPRRAATSRAAARFAPPPSAGAVVRTRSAPSWIPPMASREDPGTSHQAPGARHEVSGIFLATAPKGTRRLEADAGARADITPEPREEPVPGVEPAASSPDTGPWRGHREVASRVAPRASCSSRRQRRRPRTNDDERPDTVPAGALRGFVPRARTRPPRPLGP